MLSEIIEPTIMVAEYDNFYLIYGIEDNERYRIKIKRKKGRKWCLD